ncbi:unnamed protein product [marine sediment metagenome]|uniref:Uncharacterized protein n=1 Tax=marine sediment metagenome TaxID=412755 RepID=X1TZQ0_9ZZZZ
MKKQTILVLAIFLIVPGDGNVDSCDLKKFADNWLAGVSN